MMDPQVSHNILKKYKYLWKKNIKIDDRFIYHIIITNKNF
jgi:hypothetical protein